MNVNPLLVTLIVPTRNSGRTLENCLKSVRGQRYRPIELIVVDNHSTDQTIHIAKHYADVVESHGPERSAQRNRGAHLANGDYVLFIDSDMTLSPMVVGDCIDAVHRTGAPGVIIPEVSVGEGFLARCRALERSCYFGDDSIEAARFFPRAAFEAVGGFDENLAALEDWDLSIRIASGSHLPRAASYISHDEGRLRLGAILAKKRRYAGSSVYFWRKHGRSTFSRGNLVFRPAFLRNWRALMRHPLLALGILSLKSLEAAAGTWGILIGAARPIRAAEANPSSSSEA
jgi:glycosyltransferase involved in cell wall biosynthesis